MDRYIPVQRLATFAALALGAITLSSCGGSGSGGGGSSSGGPPPVAITTQSLPAGQVGNPYTTTLSASGGSAPYAWSLGSGTLPSGLSLNSGSGMLAGYPSAAVSAAALNFKVTDSSNPAQSKTATLALTIAPAQVQIGNTSLPNGQVSAAYSVTLNAAGGTPPYTWKLSPGAPNGLSFDSATGVLSGTPSATVTATPLTFEVLDSGNPQQTNTAILALTILPLPLVVTTTSLPCGQVGTAYAASLQASGGTLPYTWKVASGNLAALGLSLAPAGGASAISGTPTATAAAVPFSFQATDSGNPAQQTANVAMTLTIDAKGANGLVCITPARAALTVNQTIAVAAATNDTTGVSWTMTGGTVSSTTSLNGVAVNYTAPASAGVYSLTATTGSGASASISIGVTDLAAVSTWHNDLAHTGVNAQEYALTTATVTKATFGKLFSCPVDGAVYAQPLWVANLMVGGAPHNVVIVATQHDSVYAFDADDSSCQEVWPHVSLIDGAHGGTAGEIPVPSLPGCYNGPKGNDCYVGQGYFDIQPEVGVTGTPVIDPPSVTDATGTIYVVSKSVLPMGTPSTSTFYQRLHALDLTTGNELSHAPETIAASYPGGHAGGTTVTFSARQQNQRPALALVNGTVYIAWGSHEDTAPYYGWVIGYSYTSMGFTQTGVYNTTPNAGNGGIWMAGAAPAADANGNLYVISANGQFDVTNTAAPNNDYGDSFLQLTPGVAGLAVSSYFTPADQETDFTGDSDAGSGGAAVVLNLPAGGSSPQHLVVGGGKDGTVFVLNGDNMGGYVANGNNANAWQSFPLAIPPARAAIFSTGAFWNNTYYLAAAGSALLAFPFDTTALTFSTTAITAAGGTTYKSVEPYGFPGSTPSISASGAASNGLVWALSTSTYCTNESSGCGPAILRAYDAGNLGNEVWNSKLVTGDAAGNAVKFTVPTVANGKVYVGTRGNNSGGADGAPGAIDGQLDVYGLKRN
jgi:hypothetical protein